MNETTGLSGTLVYLVTLNDFYMVAESGFCTRSEHEAVSNVRSKYPEIVINAD